MPQLDKLSYATQIFWLLTLFTLFYFVVLKNILPAILLNIKTRQNMLNTVLAGNFNSATEIKSVSENFINVNFKFVNTLTTFVESSHIRIGKHYNYASFAVDFSSHGRALKPAAELNAVITSKRLNSVISE